MGPVCAFDGNDPGPIAFLSSLNSQTQKRDRKKQLLLLLHLSLCCCKYIRRQNGPLNSALLLKPLFSVIIGSQNKNVVKWDVNDSSPYQRLFYFSKFLK